MRANESLQVNLTDVLMAVKQSTMLDTHVAEVAIVEDASSMLCRILSTDVKLTCSKLQNIEIKNGDIVLILFVDRQFEENIRRLNNNVDTKVVSDALLHSCDFGIIIGIIQ